MKNLFDTAEKNMDEDLNVKSLSRFISNLYQNVINEKNNINVRINDYKDQMVRLSSEKEFYENNHTVNSEYLSPIFLNEENNVKVNEIENKIAIYKDFINILLDKKKFLDYVLNEVNTISDITTSSNSNINFHEQELQKVKILQTQELERQRIARDLHDTTVQNLTNIVHKSELALKLIESDTVRSKLELTIIRKNIRNIIKDMRGIIYNLRPMSFDDMGIRITIEKELEKLQLHGINNISYHVEGIEDNVNSIVSLTLLRIVQEACNNIIKYANANKVELKLIYNDTTIELYIEDNGVGFDLDKVQKDASSKNQSGFGLPMMNERIYLLSGTICITSEKNKGTVIYVKIPKNYKEE